MFSSPRILLSSLWLLFCALWAARSLVVRHGKRYVVGKKFLDQNTRYRVLSTSVFAAQVTWTIPMLWLDHSILLKFHNSNTLRFAGLAFCFAGLLLSVSALIHLGRNYSPCYDSHEPHHLVTTGPYRFIRHPGWLSKWLVGFGGFVVAGSWWFAPMFAWLWIEMVRTIRIEESNLSSIFPEYGQYKETTSRLIPFIY